VKNITGMMAHQCHHCSDVFKSLPQCYQHARVAHKEIIQKSWIPCRNCQKYFPTKISAYEHYKRNHKRLLTNGNIAYHCQFCTKSFTDIANCYRHAKQAHSEAVQQYWIPCPNCKKYFPTKKTLNTHTSTHCLGCEHCNKVLNSRKERRNHVEQNHPGEMLAHARVMHAKQFEEEEEKEEMSKRWTTCKVCDQKIQTGQNFVQHMTICNGNVQKCPEEMSKYWTKCLICDGKFETDRSFGLHLTICQRKEQIRQEEMSKCWTTCKVCDQKVQTGRNLVQHMTTCNVNKLLKKPEIEEEEEGCQVSKPLFSSKDVRTAHYYEYRRQLINGILAYQCQFCTEFYHPDISNCYRHARLAHNEAVQQYWIPCPNCKKYFPTKKTLVTHKHVNCLSCEYCKKVLNSRRERRNHVEQNHPEDMSKYWNIQIACKECKTIFSTKELMLAHARVMHAKQFEEKEKEEMSKCWTTCKVCDQKVQTGRNFVQHMTICSGKKLLKKPEIVMFNHMVEDEEEGCQVSKPLFSSKDVRTAHSTANDQAGPDNANPPNCTTKFEYKRQITNGIIAYHCQLCTKVYTYIYNFYRHARLAHNEAIQQYWIPCPNCQTYFPTKKALNAHTMTNCLGCEHCNKVMNSKNERRNHVEQNHLEEMSKYWTIFCLICDGKFENDRGFGLHLTTCQRKEQIICQECKKIFSTKELMLAHARVMHAKQVRLGSVMGPVIKRCPFLKNIFSKNSKNSKRFFKNFEKNRKKFYHTICTC
jgi:2'-5' RNA ligase